MRAAAYAPPCNIGLDLVYSDEAIIVANKPAGLLSVPGRGADKADSLTSRVQNEFSDAYSVHRLDMSTSGLIVLARGREMHRRMSAMFRERSVAKRYIAIVAGQMKAAAGEIEIPVGPDWPNRPLQKTDYANGKPSLTRYRLLEVDTGGNTCRVELEPVTGRTHQLRVHLAAVGHPIVGDALYGGGANSCAKRLLLHANVLSFKHPLSGQRLSFESAPPF